METIATAITPNEVRRGVGEFWEAFTHQSKDKFRELYSPAANCFAADGRCSETADAMWVRREREFFHPQSSVGARLGMVNVQLLGPNLAVASYPFHFSIVRVLRDHSRVEIEVPFARASQVFQRGSDGKLRIIHEHFSSAESTTAKPLPMDSPAETGQSTHAL